MQQIETSLGRDVAAGAVHATLERLEIWHDPGTMTAIRGSGGLEEVFVLPVFLILPGVVIGGVGGVAGAAARRLVRAG